MEGDTKTTKKKILLVDDDPQALEIYRHKFQEDSFEVVTAVDGQDALDKIKAGFIPDVIFTGILMPRLTGFELVKKIREDEKLAKIPIAISSHLISSHLISSQ